MYTYLGLSNVHGSMDHNQVPIIYYWYDQLQFSCFHDIMKMLDFFKVSSSTWYNNLKILIFSWEHWNCSWSCPMIDKCLFIIGWQALKLCLYFYSMYIHIVACMTMSYLSKYTFYLLDFVHVHESNCILVQILYQLVALYVLHLAWVAEILWGSLKIRFFRFN